MFISNANHIHTGTALKLKSKRDNSHSLNVQQYKGDNYYLTDILFTNIYV